MRAERKKQNLDFSNPNWINDERVLKKIQKIVDRYNEEFNQVEKIKKVRLVDKEWTIDGGELTPTLKLKRKIIESNYLSIIEEMYKD